MKIAVATTNGGLDDMVSPMFGRCQTFTIIEVEKGQIKDAEVIQNQYANAMSGAGIQAGGFVTNQGAKAVIAGNFGPKVSAVLNQSGVEIIPASGIKVKDAAQKYLNKEISPVSQATNPASRGMGGGMKVGRGMGRGMGSRMTQQPQMQQPTPTASTGTQPAQTSKEQQIQMLENQVKTMESQLKQIKNRLKELKK